MNTLFAESLRKLRMERGLIETTENELKSLLSNIHPKPVYHLLQDKIDGLFYIILAVEPGSDGPYETSQKAEQDKKINLKAGRYIRVRRDSRLPNRTEEYELLRKFAGLHFSSELNQTATIDDLNFEYMKEYLVRTHAAVDVRNLSKLDMAKALNLIKGSEYGGYRARNFAVLMFTEKPADFIPHAYVRIIREVKGTDKMETKIFDGPVWIQATQVRDYFRDAIMSTYTVREPGVSGAHRVSNWPLEMFEELSTNCILHKDYSRKQHIEIEVYKDHIAFINHNRPLPPVTIEDLNNQTVFTDRQYMNDELKDMFFKLDLIQSYGSGIRRAKRAMEENGSPKLVFSPNNDIDDYTLAVAYINEEYARIQEEEDFLGGNRQENRQDTERGRPLEEKILELLIEKPESTKKEIARMFGISEQSARYQLDKLKKVGRIEHQGSTKAGKWVVLK